MEDLNVYKKEGRKYVPIGYRVRDDYLTDGVWIVRHRPGCKSTTRADYLADCYGLIKAGEIAKIDLPKLGTMEDYAEVVSKVIFRNDNISLTPMDLARRIVKELFEYEEKKKEK